MSAGDGRLDLLVNSAASFERGEFTARGDDEPRRRSLRARLKPTCGGDSEGTFVDGLKSMLDQTCPIEHV
ncbi:hypothetical protein [Nannocystis punicea]|uniref:Uncharacterized protein n=1 Tax=Nannocystis punicea TaxID=2995304 RepID=A0ABY7GVH5_9BACT|nr:hypothetical protein [Nannocystis poenicansa]WAS90974.1 hypothetical protein O0S08_32700 [Nannocystis poenicansa]